MRDNFVSRVELFDLGYRTTSLQPNGRGALHTNLYETGETLSSVLEDYRLQPNANIGIVTGASLNGESVTVLDFNDKKGAFAFITEHRVATLAAETRRGVHLYFRGNFSTKRGEADQPNIYGEGSYLVAPPSQIVDFQYRWVTRLRAVSDLPFCEPEWVDFSKNRVPPEERHTEVCKIIQRPTIEWAKRILDTQYFCLGKDRKYLVLLDAAAFLIQRAGMDYVNAYQLLNEWNSDPTHVSPPWPSESLVGALEQAMQRNA